MSSNVFIHTKNTENKNILMIIYMLIPFILFGLYKNGIFLYNMKMISTVNIFKPILLVLISIVISIAFAYIYKEKILSYRLISNILISIVTFATTNILIYIVLLVGVNLLYKYFLCNIVSVYMILYSLLLLVLKKYTYLNIFENTYETNYEFSDYLFGKGFGGISNTMILFIFISFLILLFIRNYKKEIPIISLTIYYAVLLIIGFAKNNLSLDILVNANLLFGIIYVSTICNVTPYSKGGCYLYGFILGVLTICFSFIDVNLGIYIAIFILSILSKYLDNIITKSKRNLLK